MRSHLYSGRRERSHDVLRTLWLIRNSADLKLRGIARELLREHIQVMRRVQQPQVRA